MPGPFLFFLSNGNQARIAAFVAERLQQDGKQVLFVSSDRYYNQNAGLVLKTFSFPWVELSCHTSIPNWWSIDEATKVPLIQEASAAIAELLVQHQPACLILGNSQGELEQTAVRTAERLNIPTVQFQDGVMDAKPLPWDAQGIHAAGVYDGGCELYSVWSDTVRDQFRAHGLSGRVITAGNPRYDRLATWPGYTRKGAPYTVIITGQCYAKYGTMWPSAELGLYEHIINMLLTRPDLEIIFKPHPQSNVCESYKEFPKRFGNRVKIVEHGDIIEQLKSVDLLVTIASTTAVESTLMDVPTALMWYLQHDDPKHVLEGDKKFLADLHDQKFPHSFRNWDRDMSEWAGRFARKPDGQSTKRMLAALYDLVATREKQNAVSAQPEVSVLVDLKEDDYLSTVRSVLRQASSLEVIAVDRSASGKPSKDLSALISDSRLKVVHKPGVKHGPALNEALAMCRGEFVLRLHGHCVAMPGWCERLVKTLRGNTGAAVVLSYLGYRNPLGLIQTLFSLPPNISVEALLKDERAAYFLLAYGFRRSAIGNLQLPVEDEIQYDGQLVQLLAQNLNDQKRVVVEPAVLFLSPFAAAPLPQAKPTIVPVDANSIRVSGGGEIEISVLLSSYNREAKVKKCLEALRTQTIPHSQYEVICVNDGSTDGTGQAMKEGLNHLPGRYFEHDRNRALAAGRNTALRHAHGKLVLFINDDTYATPNFLEEHIRSHRELNRPMAAVHGFLPFIEDYKNRIFSLALMQEDLYFGYTMLEPGKEYWFWHFITGNLSVPRAAFVDNNVRFDETFIRYGYEDIECGYRLWNKGMRVFYNPKAVAIHDHKITIREYVRREESNSVNILQFLVKHPDPILAQTLLTVPKITNELVSEWQEFATSNKEKIENLISQIESVEDSVPDLHNGGSHNALDLVKQVGEATRLIGYYVKFKTFVEALNQYPELRDVLLSPDWMTAVNTRAQQLGMAV